MSFLYGQALPMTRIWIPGGMWMMERFQLRTFLLWWDGYESHFKRTSRGSMKLRHAGASPWVPWRSWQMVMGSLHGDSQGWTPFLHDMRHASLTPASELADGWNGMWLNRICFDPWCWQSFGRNWLQIGPTSEHGCPSTAVPGSLSWSTPSVPPSPSTTMIHLFP